MHLDDQPRVLVLMARTTPDGDLVFALISHEDCDHLVRQGWLIVATDPQPHSLEPSS